MVNYRAHVVRNCYLTKCRKMKYPETLVQSIVKEKE